MPWSYRNPTGRPPHPDVLTPAEWRVLEHVRAGRSNPEIAEALGVSVNTVRTHVSSMLGKLELRDRRALAAWQGEPAEASRLALGRSWVGAWLTASGGWAGRIMAGAGLAIGAAVFLLVMQSTNQSGERGGVASATPTATAPAGPTETPAPTSTPTPTPTPAPAASPLYPALSVGDPVELPEGVALYVWGGCTGCDAPLTELRRFVRTGGVVDEQVVFERTVNTPYILQAAVPGWVEDDVVYVFECTTGYCGGVGEATADASVTLYRSLDAGTTWESLGTQPLPPGAILANPQLTDWGVAPLLSSLTSARNGDDGAFLVGEVEVDLRGIDGRGVAEGGSFAYNAAGQASVGETGRFALRWFVRVSPNDVLTYLTVFEPDGSPAATYEARADGIWLDADRLVGTVVYESRGLYQSAALDYGWLPSIIDLRDGSVHPIIDPFGDDPTNRNLVVGVGTP